jgi:hypothetical protein
MCLKQKGGLSGLRTASMQTNPSSHLAKRAVDRQIVWEQSGCWMRLLLCTKAWHAVFWVAAACCACNAFIGSWICGLRNLQLCQQLSCQAEATVSPLFGHEGVNLRMASNSHSILLRVILRFFLYQWAFALLPAAGAVPRGLRKRLFRGGGAGGGKEGAAGGCAAAAQAPAPVWRCSGPPL